MIGFFDVVVDAKVDKKSFFRSLAARTRSSRGKRRTATGSRGARLPGGTQPFGTAQLFALPVRECRYTRWSCHSAKACSPARGPHRS